MANRKRLKTLRKGRHNSKAGKRNRSKRKKSVAEKRRLRMLGQDNLLNEQFHTNQELADFMVIQ